MHAEQTVYLLTSLSTIMVNGGYLGASKLSRSGRPLSHHTALLQVRTSDTVLHYANGGLRAVSEVLSSAEEAPRPIELPTEPWNTEGHLVRTRYHNLPSPVPWKPSP